MYSTWFERLSLLFARVGLLLLTCTSIYIYVLPHVVKLILILNITRLWMSWLWRFRSSTTPPWCGPHPHHMSLMHFIIITFMHMRVRTRQTHEQRAIRYKRRIHLLDGVELSYRLRCSSCCGWGVRDGLPWQCFALSFWWAGQFRTGLFSNGMMS